MDLKALHATKSIKARPTRKRVGRGPGSGLGKTSGRGQKGAGARSGHKIRDFYEGGQTPLMRRIPKRGFSNDDFGTVFAAVNVSELNRFADGTEVTPKLLAETGLVKRALGGLKVLGDGELERKLKVSAHKFSKSAVDKIVARGGEAVTIAIPRSLPKKGGKAKGKPAPAAAPAAKPAEGKPQKKASKKEAAE